MDNVDGSDHYATESRGPTPALLNVVIDTNPHAWALIKDRTSFSETVANLEVFINAHLAFNHANQVTVIASHLQKAEFLYPPRKQSHSGKKRTSTGRGRHDRRDEDVEMQDDRQDNTSGNKKDYGSFYKPFADLKGTLDSALNSLMRETTVDVVKGTNSTSLAGALTLALNYTNKLETSINDQDPGALASSALATDSFAKARQAALNARIVILSVSVASPTQYIPLMNTIFAAQRMRVPIDVISIPLKTSSSSATNPDNSADPSSSFLQQAADATQGIFMPLKEPHGLLQTLLMAYLPSGVSREMLVLPTTSGVDFRAACFCHQNTVDIGYVCSVCLSIFCDAPDEGICLTCGTPLKTGGDGWAKKPAVLPRLKKKKRKREDGVNGGDKRRETTPLGGRANGDH